MRALISVGMFFLSSSAFAYVNPGAGITFLGAVLGLVAALLFVVVGLVLWPVRRYLQHKKAQQAAQEKTAQEKNTGPQDPPAHS